MRERRVTPEILDQARKRLTRRRAQPQESRLPAELVGHFPDRSVSAAGAVDDRREVFTTEAVDIGGGERVYVDARAEIGERTQEREKQPNFRPTVEPGAAGEPPRDAGEVQAPQDRVRVRVRTNEHRVVPRTGTGGDPSADFGGDPVRLLRPRRECLQPDASGLI